MKALYLQHVPFEGPAYIATILTQSGLTFNGCAVYDFQPYPSLNDFDLLFVMGGPMGVHDEVKHSWMKNEKLFIEDSIKAGKKIVGICLGAQLIADVLGAAVTKNTHKEIGWFPVEKSDRTDSTNLWKSMPQEFNAFHWHGETFAVPNGAIHLAQSEACDNQAFLYKENILALQFHLESTAKSIEQLYENCSEELDNSEFVQSKDQILQPDHINSSNNLMRKILLDVIKI